MITVQHQQFRVNYWNYLENKKRLWDISLAEMKTTHTGGSFTWRRGLLWGSYGTRFGFRFGLWERTRFGFRCPNVPKNCMNHDVYLLIVSCEPTRHQIKDCTKLLKRHILSGLWSGPRWSIWKHPASLWIKHHHSTAWPSDSAELVIVMSDAVAIRWSVQEHPLPGSHHPVSRCFCSSWSFCPCSLWRSKQNHDQMELQLLKLNEINFIICVLQCNVPDLNSGSFHWQQMLHCRWLQPFMVCNTKSSKRDTLRENLVSGYFFTSKLTFLKVD